MACSRQLNLRTDLNSGHLFLNSVLFPWCLAASERDKKVYCLSSLVDRSRRQLSVKQKEAPSDTLQRKKRPTQSPAQPQTLTSYQLRKTLGSWSFLHPSSPPTLS